MKRVWLAALLAAVMGWTAGMGRGADTAPSTDSPQPTTTKAAPKSTDVPDKTEEKAKGRLPPFYGKLVDKDQKEKIYQIEMTFTPKIKDLQRQIDALVAERNEQIKAVLTPEQQAKLADMVADSKSKRGKGKDHSSDSKSSTTPKTSEQPAVKNGEQPAVKTGDQPTATSPAPAPKGDPSAPPASK
jgi:hypothetical protein